MKKTFFSIAILLFVTLISKGQNIYTSDGTLTGDRTVILNSNKLIFSNTGSVLEQGNTGERYGFILQANTGGKFLNKGASLEFSMPANGDGTNFWSLGRIITVPANTTSANATGKMILGTRRMFDKYKTGSQWYFGDDIVINGNGNVGIGTENPGYKLDVVGDIRMHNLILPSGFNITPYPGDGFTYNTKNMGHYALQWVDDPWNRAGNSLWMSAYGGVKFFTRGLSRLVINEWGYVGIGTDNPQNKLDVNGTIRATEVKVEAGWSDFVFDKDYKLPTLQEVENHINEHKHLPDIPSEAEVKENGVSLGEMQAKLLQKIEELTLYTIELNKTVKEQGEKIQKLEAERSINE